MVSLLMITILLLLASFAAGFYAGVKNASSSKVAKVKTIADEIRK